MSHKAKDAKPAGCEDKECTHEHIVAHSLTIKPPGTQASVTIMGGSTATGIWVQTGNGQECVGLVAQEGVGPYLVIYDEEAKGLPLAVCNDHIQLPNIASTTTPIMVPFSDLLKAIRQVQSKAK